MRTAGNSERKEQSEKTKGPVTQKSLYFSNTTASTWGAPRSLLTTPETESRLTASTARANLPLGSMTFVHQNAILRELA